MYCSTFVSGETNEIAAYFTCKYKVPIINQKGYMGRIMVFLVGEVSKIFVRARMQIYNLSKTYLKVHWALSKRKLHRP